MSATEDDTELRDLLVQNLENSGVLNKLKVQLLRTFFPLNASAVRGSSGCKCNVKEPGCLFLTLIVQSGFKGVEGLWRSLGVSGGSLGVSGGLWGSLRVSGSLWGLWGVSGGPRGSLGVPEGLRGLWGSLRSLGGLWGVSEGLWGSLGVPEGLWGSLQTCSFQGPCSRDVEQNLNGASPGLVLTLGPGDRPGSRRPEGSGCTLTFYVFVIYIEQFLFFKLCF